MAAERRILVKLRPSGAHRAAGSSSNLRPLHANENTVGLGAATSPEWYVADLPDGAATPWDLAHSQVAAELGVAESDVLIAEPDLVHSIFDGPQEPTDSAPLALADRCESSPQDESRGKATGPDTFGWHLGPDFSQLEKARDAVLFEAPRTRIAHLDTGYDPQHETKPRHLLKDLERNYVEDDNPNSAVDPGGKWYKPDHAGHGTGTIGILAGDKVTAEDVVLGGAPGAEILPIRVAESVILLRTSALAQAFRYAADHQCDVLSLSMGGLPSHVWAEEAYNAYMKGVCIVAAAGNNVNGAPARSLVYPARFQFVIAVCGAMADGTPYHNLKWTALEGNYGPKSRMESAITSYTPNIPWPRFQCGGSVIRLDGEGTSAATPQVAAAAALWIEKNKQVLPDNWRRVEAVRRALFSSAKSKSRHKKEFGNGILQAHKALALAPDLGLPRTEPENNDWAFFRIITGRGVDAPSPRERMFNLELTHRWMLNPELSNIVPDPDGVDALSDKDLRKFMEAVIEDEGASSALRANTAERYAVLSGGAPPPKRKKQASDESLPHASDRRDATVPSPPYRRVRVYAVDPSFSTRLETAGSNEVALHVRWEDVTPGPSGEYLRVEDKDPFGRSYKPVNLDRPTLLAQDGHAPSEGNAQFHQQMVYAVVMKTIGHFERALGRPVLWRSRPVEGKPYDDGEYVGQLKVNPHALWQANAYYSPHEVALLFGYFEASAGDPGDHVPGSLVYSCLSHDIIAHETTHAILDGMYRRFNEATNPDVLALHEGFADIVALMQHFTLPEVLTLEISRTRGDLEAESMLGSLAVQFGKATGRRSALRDAIGRLVDGEWERIEPDPADLEERTTPHARGAILVAAVFDAFIAIYKTRTADLLRIYTAGTGVLPAGAIHPDLVQRLVDAAAKSAGHVLTICIRALDYLPPVDVTFGEYLRALITADFDLVGDDRHNYRVAFIESFRRRGIYPRDIRALSVETLLWDGAERTRLPKAVRSKVEHHFAHIIEFLKEYADECTYIESREELFETTRSWRRKLYAELKKAFTAVPQFAEQLGVVPGRSFEVHELRRAIRVGPSSKPVPQLVIALTQSVNVAKTKDTPAHTFRGGSTLIVDLADSEVKYAIVKRVKSESRRERTADFQRQAASDPLRKLLFAPGDKEPFAMLHSVGDD